MFGKVRAWSRRHEKAASALRVAPLAVLCTAFAVPYAATEPVGPAALSLGVPGFLGLSAALIVPLAWRDRPLATFAAVSLVSFAQWLAGIDPLPANFSVLVALWGWPTGARSVGRWRRAW
ncbi:hypothetical protein ACFQYP_39600 [Nonomuraea antimicrobica]